ncbi:hypothetical protein KS4_06660 [Poriferisphaera corsica]|uniref:Uncharacterized protein n=1 Tax=Poriferisphaera corsica TaxID=2528020 RepID=A0A517YQW9_9BACT|nr:hypothetical protein [Poriferisphaera corsica]QDU32632.1 hypothetical protein KS4_06660 [Poriferisphaera corsica]
MGEHPRTGGAGLDGHNQKALQFKGGIEKLILRTGGGGRDWKLNLTDRGGRGDGYDNNDNSNGGEDGDKRGGQI